MKNKVIVKLLVPEIDQSYDIVLPVNRKIGNIVKMISESINELSNGLLPISDTNILYNSITKEFYQSDILLANTNIRNGSILVLLTK